MKTIYKYYLELDDSPIVKMPLGAEIIAFQLQYGNPYLWAIVDPSEMKLEDRKFQLYGTGHQFRHTEGKYIGTIQQMGGQLVWHLFEEVNH